MPGILVPRECVLTGTVASRTGKIVKNCLSVFEGGENLLQNGLFELESGIVLES